MYGYDVNRILIMDNPRIRSKFYVLFTITATMALWFIELLLWVPDIIMGVYFLFVKHPMKTIPIVAILLLMWYTGILSDLISTFV